VAGGGGRETRTCEEEEEMERGLRIWVRDIQKGMRAVS